MNSAIESSFSKIEGFTGEMQQEVKTMISSASFDYNMRKVELHLMEKF
jgi:hypothetical protein